MSLPGDFIGYVSQINTICERCCQQKATVYIQGESDSFGYETVAVCADCQTKARAPISGTCDWCKGEGRNDIKATRDPDEGTRGPVYHACAPCRKKAADAYLDEEFDSTEAVEGWNEGDFGWD